MGVHRVKRSVFCSQSAGRRIGRGVYVTTSGVAGADVLTATDDVFASLAQC
jgi:hypothetical protein